ncbi:unnamed protein product [Clonostachys chloroleuca]|uniref:Uncharacterized protein n=1 Tax=Clonostachys chloroleuca TaxID=1926264 RepID=A0AA35QAX2_9HYPO|nr:unnamed protein product [Clonostachys chloroleuca]
MIIGDQEDEAPLFAMDEMAGYLSDVLFSGATIDQLTSYVDTYGVAILEGSPFCTGIFNDWYLGFRSLAAILGDMIFILAWRNFLNAPW